MARFPRYLHQPIQVLDYEPDDVAIFLAFFVMAMVFGGKIYWFLAFAVPFFYRRFKMNYPRGFVKHLFYFLGIMKMNHYPTFFQKEFNE